jgi:hypothetical protein
MLEKIPLYLGSYRNVDEVDLGTLGAVLQDVYVDELNNIRKRPGMSTIVDISTNAPCDGLYWWYKQSMAIYISAQKIYKITAAAGTNAEITGTGTPEDATRAYFADFGTSLYAANGGKIIAIPSSGNASYLADGDAPTTVSHVAVLNGKLIALDTSLPATFEWSDADAPTSWTNNFASPNRIPDDLKALAVGNDRLWLWGSHSLEIWVDDGLTPFVPEYNGHWSDGGIIGKNAFTFVLGQFYWINQNRDLVRLNGAMIEPLPSQQSQSLSLYLQGFATISDAILEPYVIAGRHFVKMDFPTQDKTILYDIIGNRWHPWGEWDGTDYKRLNAVGIAFADAWNIRLVGDKNSGLLHKIDPNYYTPGQGHVEDSNGDLILDSDDNPLIAGEDSSDIRMVIRPPVVSHGAFSKRKFSSKYTMTLKRFSTVSTDDITVSLRYRNNGSSTWTTARNASITQVDDTTFRATWRRNGAYYNRQLEFVISDAAPILVSPELEEEI